MSLLNRLLGIWAVGQTVSATTPLILRLMAGVAAIVLGAIVMAILVGILLIIGLRVAYLALVNYGISDGSALAFIVAFILFLILMLYICIRGHWTNTSFTARNLLYMHSPLPHKLNLISNAFMKGFREIQVRRYRPRDARR